MRQQNNEITEEWDYKRMRQQNNEIAEEWDYKRMRQQNNEIAEEWDNKRMRLQKNEATKEWDNNQMRWSYWFIGEQLESIYTYNPVTCLAYISSDRMIVSGSGK